MGVVLGAVEIGLDLVGRQKPHRVAQLADLALPIVGAAAGLQRDLAGRYEILQHPLSSERFADYHTPTPIDTVQLEDLLCDIQSDSCNLHAWILPQFFSMADCHRWLIMQPLNTGWVHPSNESVLTAGLSFMCGSDRSPEIV